MEFWPKKRRFEPGSEVERGFDSEPVTPLICGFKDFIQPSMWSNERFSWTRTTTVLIGNGGFGVSEAIGGGGGAGWYLGKVGVGFLKFLLQKRGDEG